MLSLPALPIEEGTCFGMSTDGPAASLGCCRMLLRRALASISAADQLGCFSCSTGDSAPSPSDNSLFPSLSSLFLRVLRFLPEEEREEREEREEPEESGDLK